MSDTPQPPENTGALDIREVKRHKCRAPPASTDRLPRKHRWLLRIDSPGELSRNRPLGMAQHNVFITGGTGYLGRRLIPALHARGHIARALVRRESQHKLPSP